MDEVGYILARMDADIETVSKAMVIFPNDLIPKLSACVGGHDDAACVMCPYWCGFIEGGCCHGLLRTVTLAWGDWKCGRMSRKRYKHRLETLRDWLVAKRKEVADEPAV